MKLSATRFDFFMLLLIAAMMALGMVLFSAGQAHAIGRRFACSGGCAPHVVHHAAPVIQQRDILQNFFIGLTPTPLDSPQGTTRYLRSFADEVPLASDKDYLNLGTLLATGAGDAMAIAKSVRPGLEAIATRNADANLALAKGEAAANLIRSFDSSSGTAKTVVLTLRNGKVDAFQELQATPAEAPQVEPAPVPRTPIDLSGNVCLKCHAAGAPNADKFVIDDTFTFAKYQKAKAAVESGAMPPKSALTDGEKDAVVLKLGKLVP